LAGVGVEDPGLAGTGVEEPGLAGLGVEEPGLAEVEFVVSFVDDLIRGSRNFSHPAITNAEKSAVKIIKGKNKVFVCTK
jgi:hypothetical protein